MFVLLGSKLKSSKILYKMYSFIGNFLLAMMRLVFKNKKKIIIFNSFGGKKVDDSPYEIFKEMKSRETFRNYKMIWAAHSTDFEEMNKNDIVSTNSFTFFKLAIQAELWVTNSSMQRGLKVKSEGTVYLNTWHGTPLKYMGKDIIDKNQSFQIREDKEDVDYFSVQGEYEKEIFRSAFSMSDNQFLDFGYPRNDRLVSFFSSEIENIKKKLGIDNEKQVILYAPTFRPEVTDEKGRIVMDKKVKINQIADELKENYVLLIRAHYEAYLPEIDGKYNGILYDVSDYPNLNDLLIISDVLISDYSSVFFDFSLLSKPMIAFIYDFDNYNQTRGLYFDLREYLPCVYNTDELIKMIRDIDFDSKKYVVKSKDFRQQFVKWYGDATIRTVNFIEDILL